MTTTIGTLIANLFDRYRSVYQDDKLAAFATSTKLQELIDRAKSAKRS